MKLAVISLLGASVMATGCTTGEETEDKEESWTPSAPSAVMTVDNLKYEMAVGSTRWDIQQANGEQRTVQTDSEGPKTIADTIPAVESSPDALATIQLKDDRGPDRIVGYQWGKERQRADINEHEPALELPEETGVYEYELVTHWLEDDYEGEVTYAVRVRVS